MQNKWPCDLSQTKSCMPLHEIMNKFSNFPFILYVATSQMQAHNRLANPMNLIDFKQFQTAEIRFEIKKSKRKLCTQF